MEEIMGGKIKTKPSNLPQRIFIGGNIWQENNCKQSVDCFINIGPNLASKFQSYKDILYEHFLKYEGPVLEIKKFPDDELHKAFFIVKCNNSPG